MNFHLNNVFEVEIIACKCKVMQYGIIDTYFIHITTALNTHSNLRHILRHTQSI